MWRGERNEKARHSKRHDFYINLIKINRPQKCTTFVRISGSNITIITWKQSLGKSNNMLIWSERTAILGLHQFQKICDHLASSEIPDCNVEIIHCLIKSDAHVSLLVQIIHAASHWHGSKAVVIQTLLIKCLQMLVCRSGKSLGWTAFIQGFYPKRTIWPNIHPFTHIQIHTPTAVSAMQGDSQLVGSS